MENIKEHEKELLDYCVKEFEYDEGYYPSENGIKELLEYIKEHPRLVKKYTYYSTHDIQIKKLLSR